MRKWVWALLPVVMALAADRIALEGRLTSTNTWAEAIKAQLDRIEAKLDRHLEK